jgi:predicted TPR repeat methyltransferase
MNAGNDDSEPALARVMKARSLRTVEEASELYADWAQTYDADVFGRLKVTGSNRIADLLAQHIPRPCTTAVLDAGCGTGAVAMQLAGHGFGLIDGIDLSPEMLAVAASKNIYRQLAVINLNNPFELEYGPYLAIISAGTFTTGHVGQEGFENLMAHLASGGVLACAIAHTVWARDGFARFIDDPAIEVLFHQVEPVIPYMPADTHMLVGRKMDHAA